MKDLFANDNPAAGGLYRNIRDPTTNGARRARAVCDDLWRDFAPYASRHFIAEFPKQCHQRWFEMYLAVSLLRIGLKVYCPDGDAPDLRVDFGDNVLWLEATAPTGGVTENPDYIPELIYRGVDEEPMAHQVPTDKVILRVAGALATKSEQIRRYRESGVIGAKDAAAVAINIGAVPHGFFDPQKYALGATYGQGAPYIAINRATGMKTRSGWLERSEISRSSGASVDIAPFLNPGYAHVSGAVVSGLDVANSDAPYGRDLLQLPNPLADIKYPEGRIELGKEWRLQDVGVGSFAIDVVKHQ